MRYGTSSMFELRPGARPRALAVFTLALALLAPLAEGAPAGAQRSSNPHDAVVRDLERDVLRFGRRPAESGRALPPMLRIEQLRDRAADERPRPPPHSPLPFPPPGPLP